MLSPQSQRLLLHQICFELYENATQELLKSVRQTLPRASTTPASDAGAASSESMALDGSASKSWEPPVDLIAEAKRIDAVLAGDITIRLHLEFLFRNNKTDLAILRATKAAVENRISALHNATVFANGLMHAGTSVDAFLRENLEWLGRAANWAKFSAVASLGVIHKVRAMPQAPQPTLALAPACPLTFAVAVDDASRRATCPKETRCSRRTCRSRACRARRTRRAAPSLRSA